MIFQLANRYQRSLGRMLLLLFYISFLSPIYAYSHVPGRFYYPVNNELYPLKMAGKTFYEDYLSRGGKPLPEEVVTEKSFSNAETMVMDDDNGGPSKPEANSFKSVSANDLVNLFTGSFSYNIPLLDVGGYPVNLFYNGEPGMEDEASWVGAGWNINPGAINRNMRGVPDDFDGTDSVKQTVQMKPNITVGGALGASFELFGIENLKGLGIEANISLGLGVLNNNYLGPALDLNVGPNISFSLSNATSSEKNTSKDKTIEKKDSGITGSLTLGANLGISSRNGTTFTRSASLGVRHREGDNSISFGAGASIDYNSRVGIKSLNLYEQVTFSQYREKQASEAGKEKKKTRNNVSAPINLHNSSISFAKGTYMPSLRIPVTNNNYAGSVRFGGGMFGISGGSSINAYKQESSIEDEDIVQLKPMIGFMYSDKAGNNQDAIMDFTRLNDKEVTPNTPIISATQYAYDVFSITGEGTGGVIRAYLKSHGIAKDNYSQTKDRSLNFGADLGLPGHVGADYNQVKTPTTISEWTYGNNIRNQLQTKENTKLTENVYFRNPGESSVLNDNEYENIGNEHLVRFKLDGTGSNPRILPTLEKFSTPATPSGIANLLNAPLPQRKKRTQVINVLTAEEAQHAGLEKKLHNYLKNDPVHSGYVPTLKNNAINRVGAYRKPHHISEITVTEGNGLRYVYGQPVYNIKQLDYTFTVANSPDSNDLVTYAANEITVQSPHVNKNAAKDGLVQITETPAYASSFLLTALVSPDYVDVTGDGITPDDLGTAVKFNYTESMDIYKWRTPVTKTGNYKAHSNEGYLSTTKDDKGIITYGERESWYLHSIETKTMIAVFRLQNRDDAKGVLNINGLVNGNDASQQRLERIDLYNRADVAVNGFSGSVPVKTVWFNYSYKMFKNAPGNPYLYPNSGRLTLESIHFTYGNGQRRTEKEQYVFEYNEGPDYQMNSMDRWGTYKPRTDNPGSLKNSDYPYAVQDSTKAAENGKSWALSKILLPSGSQIEVTYESNDYAYVQNKRAARMMGIRSLGRGNIAGSNTLYDVIHPGYVENTRVYINVPVNCTTREDVYNLYLEGVNQLAFKLVVEMPQGKEKIPVYANIADYGVGTVPNTIWIELQTERGYSPLTLASIDFLRDKLPGQAFPGYDVSESAGMDAVAKMLAGMGDGLKGIFKDVIKHLRSKGLARNIVLEESFVRLNEPTGKKYGGGIRVKKVVLKDNWDKLAGLYLSEYGQVYDYTKVERFSGSEKRISSGVASYEPAIGAVENPFLEIVQVADRLPKGPTSYGAIEMPVLDAFFPAAVVGYSKVTVYSINKFKKPVDKKTRSGIGKQVSEFYTTRDYPVKYKHTLLDRTAEKYFHDQSRIWEFFASYSLEARALTQGFLVELNDMNGKMKSQSSYSEDDENTPINYVAYFYKNTGRNGMADKFEFAHHQLGGEIREGNMGVDIELMTDTREFTTRAMSTNVQAQVEWMVPFPTIWLPVILPTMGDHINEYRAVTTTKVVNYKAVMDSMVVIDKGSVVGTKNLIYDSETGAVIVSRINNEFDEPVYNTNYPAYWAYSGMGPAYKNIGAIYKKVGFRDGKIVSGMSAQEIRATFESGDELFIINSAAPADECGNGLFQLYPSVPGQKVWVVDKRKNDSTLTIMNPDFIFINAKGEYYTAANVDFKIVRSGKRNMLGENLTSFVTLKSPVSSSWPYKLQIDNTKEVLNSAAVTYKEFWQADIDLFRKGNYRMNEQNCKHELIEDCSGAFEYINPYLKGLYGNFRQHQNFVFHGDRTLSTITTQLSNLSKDGTIASFAPYWNFNSNNNLIPTTNSQWIFTNEMTRVNANGLQMESKDALGTYTATLYGHQKTLPVAIASNARSYEMAYAGFEDILFNNNMDDLLGQNCPNNQFFIKNTPAVMNAVYPFVGHTGTSSLRVNSGQTLVLNDSIKITNSVPHEGKLNYSGIDTLKLLYDIGLTADTIKTNLGFSTEGIAGTRTMRYTNQNYYTVVPDTIGVILSSNDRTVYHVVVANDTSSWTFFNKIHFYVHVKESKNYQFDVNVVSFSNQQNPTNNRDTWGTLKITDTAGKIIYDTPPYLIAGVFFNGENNFSLNLCAGIYKFEMSYYEFYSGYVGQGWINPTPNRPVWLHPFFKVQTDIPSKPYKSLDDVPGCTYSTPIPANDSLMNPGFALTPGKKMLLSSWVKENCPVNCNLENFTLTKMKLVFRDASNTIIGTEEFSASGPIIDGWQKIERDFIPPAGAVRASFELVNTGSSPAYFDDIRIHPYDAQMMSYSYDTRTSRLLAQMDENNYSTFYDYDEDGSLIRTRVETERGIKTINETRSHKQTTVKTIQ